MIPHSWTLENLELAQMSENTAQFIRKKMKNWNTKLTSCGECLAKVDIRIGIFQGENSSSLLFVICMIPLIQINESELKKNFWIEYLKGTKLIRKMKLSGRNKIMPISSWAVF